MDKPNKDGAIDYEQYLKEVVTNQHQIIKLLENQAEAKKLNKKQAVLDRIYNYTIFILIIFVALIWIVYVINNFLLN